MSKRQKLATPAAAASGPPEAPSDGAPRVGGAEKGEAAEAEDKGRTVAVRLSKLLVDAGSEDVLERAVQRVHRVVLFATEAIALVVQADIDRGVALDSMLPLSGQGKVNSMFLAVVEDEVLKGGKTKVRVGAQNRAPFDRVRAAFRRIHGDDAPLVPAGGLPQLVNYEARYFIATLKTGLVMHYRKRVFRYCKLRLRLSSAAYAALDKQGRKAQTSRVLRAATDVCRPGWMPPVADAADAAFVNATRATLGLSAVPWGGQAGADGRTVRRRRLDEVLKEAPQRFLPGMAALNRAFAAAGERTFRLLPMRTTLAPRFITIDQEVLKELGLVGAEAKRKLAADNRRRREQQAPFDADLAALRRAHAEERQAWAQADAAAVAEAAEAEEGAKHKVPKEEAQRRAARKKAMAAEVKARKEVPAYAALLDGAAAEKRVGFEAVFDATRVLSKRDAAAWKHSLKTDGVSARLLLEPRPLPTAAKHSRDGGRALPRRGLISVERLREAVLGSEKAPELTAALRSEIDGLSPQQQNELLNELLGWLPFTIVGADPGLWELLVLINPDLVPPRRKDAEAALGPDRPPSPSLGLLPDGHSVPRPPPRWRGDAQCLGEARRRQQRYTQPQRREDMKPGRYFLKKRHAPGGSRPDPERQRRADAARAYRHQHLRTPDQLLEAERVLASHCSKGPTEAKLLAFLRARSAALPTLLEWHAHRRRRLIRWKRFAAEQRSFSQFCDRIRAMGRLRQRGSGTDARVVIAYGAWALSGGLPGKGLPPCIGKGLLRKLSREFVIVAVPEHYTSKRCFHCGGACGNHAYLAERDRRAGADARLEAKLEERLARAETEEQRAAAARWFDAAMGRPCEIRGLRFCEGCCRCLNRDANSAPQMAVQLKRLVLGLSPLHRVSDEDRRLQKMRLATEDGEDE